MKNIILLLIIIIACASCKDACKDTVCINGGGCIDGSCLCPTGYSGEHCEIYTPPVAKHEKADVTYSLECANCNVTYINQYGATETWNNMNSNWAFNFVGYTGDPLYFSAYNNDSTGAVTARIKLNGVTYKLAISTGGKTTTAVGGNIP